MATQLASGYVELTIRPGKAMGEIKKDLLGLDKVAKKAGTDAGKALTTGINKSAKASDIKGYFNPFVRQGRTAGADAGKALSKGFNSSVDISTGGIKSALSGVSNVAASEGKQAGSKFSTNFMQNAKSKMSSGGKELLSGIGGGAESAMTNAGSLAGGSFLAGMAPKIMQLGTKAGPVGLALAATAGLALAAGAVVGDQFMKGVERQTQRSEIKAKVGLDDAQAAAVFKQAEIAYTNNFGASIKENVDTATQLIQSGLAKAGDTGLNKMIGQVSTVAQVTGASSEEIIKATNSMVKSGIVDNVQEAMDILVKGQQEGLNASGDLLDTFNEYSGQFKKVGLDAKTALGLVNQLMQGGARNSDLAADAIKEFSIRAVDGSEQTNKAFSDLGLNWETVSANFAAGGDVAKQQFAQVTQAIAGIQDPVKKAQIAVALFGTQAEDLGPALNNIDPTTAVDSLGEIQGAAKNAGNELTTGPTAGFDKLGRQVEVAQGQFQDLLVKGLGPIAAKLADLIQDHLPTIIRLFGKILGAGVDMAKGILDFVGDITIAVGQLIGGIGNIVGAVARVQQKIAQFSGDDEAAQGFKEEADAAFGWGDSIEEAGQKIKDQAQGLDKFKDQVTDTADEIANATEVSNELGDSIEVLPDKKTIKVTDTSEKSLKKLKDLGYTTRTLPDGTVEVVAETDEAQEKMDSWRRQQTGEPLPIKPTVDTEATKQYKKDLEKQLKDAGGIAVPLGDPGAVPSLSNLPKPAGGNGPHGGPSGGGSANPTGLKPAAAQIMAELHAAYPKMDIWGDGDKPDHNNHGCVDAMTLDTPTGLNLGDKITAHYLKDKRVKWVIWKQHMWYPDGTNRLMESRQNGDRNANHFTHPHIQVYKKGGGVPGFGRGDKVPALLEPDEHVFTKSDVAAMGGQKAVYAFRQKLNGPVSRTQESLRGYGLFSTGGQVPDWDRIAQAESGGLWFRPDGDADSTGGLQIQTRTWLDFGGGAYAPEAYQASKAEQIAVAEKILAVQGPGAWAGGKNFFWKAGTGSFSSTTPTKGVTAEQRSTANAEATQAQNDLDVALAERDEMAKDEAFTTEAKEARDKRLAEKDTEIAALRRARDTAKATSERLGSLPAGDEEDPVIAAEEDARQQQAILEQEQAKLADLKKSGAVQSEIIKQQGVIDQQQIKVNDAQAAITTARSDAAKETWSENSSFNSDNPYMMIMEGLKKIIPDPGTLADIGLGGIKDTFLPKGFSDPQDWGISKIASGLLGFAGGLIPGPGGYVLRGIGAGVGGDAGGMVNELMGGFLPAPFGDVPWEIGPDGQVRSGVPGMTEEQFAASSHGSTPGAIPVPGAAPVPVASGVGTGPPPGPMVDASIHIGDVNRGDGAAVVQKASNQQAANTRANFGTRRV